MSAPFIDEIIKNIYAEFSSTGFFSILDNGMTLDQITTGPDSVRIDFHVDSPAPRNFSLRLSIPRARGDDIWNRYDPDSEDISQWVRWSISVPLLETFETRSSQAVYHPTTDRWILPSP